MDTIERDTGGSLAIDPDSDEPANKGPTRKRRSYSNAFKRQIVEETLADRDSVSVVARRHDVNANQLFRWRKQYHDGLLADEPAAQALIPVAVQELPISESATKKSDEKVRDAGRLEVILTGGHQLVVTATFCQSTLRTALMALLSC